jgi:hypothetical protein
MQQKSFSNCRSTVFESFVQILEFVSENLWEGADVLVFMSDMVSNAKHTVEFPFEIAVVLRDDVVMGVAIGFFLLSLGWNEFPKLFGSHFDFVSDSKGFRGFWVAWDQRGLD